MLQSCEFAGEQSRRSPHLFCRQQVSFCAMAGDFLLRSKWWPVRDKFSASETSVVADVAIPSGCCSLPIVSSLNLRRFLGDKPVKLVLKVSCRAS